MEFTKELAEEQGITDWGKPIKGGRECQIAKMIAKLEKDIENYASRIFYFKSNNGDILTLPFQKNTGWSNDATLKSILKLTDEEVGITPPQHESDRLWEPSKISSTIPVRILKGFKPNSTVHILPQRLCQN